MDGAPDASVDREPMKPPIENRGPVPLPQQAIDEDDELYEAPVCRRNCRMSLPFGPK